MIRALLALLYVDDFMIDDYRIDDFIRASTTADIIDNSGKIPKIRSQLWCGAGGFKGGWNVFEIQPGVAVAIIVKYPKSPS